VAPGSFVKSLDSLARQFLWAGNLSSTKWSLIKWETVCSPKRFGGLGAIRSWSLNNMWEGKSSGGRESGTNSLGQSVIALLGRWLGIDA